MMNKIFNWTFGSFFRTIGRFMFYILICIIISNFINFKDIKISNIFDVYALDQEINVITGNPNETEEYVANINSNYYTTMNLSGYNRSIVYNCSSDSSCSGSVNSDISSGGVVFNGTMANYGFDLAHATNEIITTNHLYSYTYNVCIQNGVSSISNDIYIGSGLSSNRLNKQTITRFDYFATNNIIWNHYDSSGANVYSGTSCYTVYNLFNYTGGNSTSVKINLKTSSFSNRYIGFLGYKLEDLGATNGLTTSQVQSVINNSGLATASSIQDVQSSISQVEDDLSDLNSQSIQNTQDIMDNQDSNTQDIIDNQNTNSQAQIDSQKVCSDKILTYEDAITKGYISDTLGNINTNTTTWKITDYIEINKLEILNKYNSAGAYSCFYDKNKTIISCITVNENTGIYNLPNNTVYGRFSIRNTDIPEYKIGLCRNGNQAMQDTITDSNSSEAQSSASSFFDNFTTNTHGLTGIITAPLSAIQSLTNQSCTPLELPLPFVNKNLNLPCMRPIYQQYFGDFMTLYDIITLGIISYWVMVRIFGLVKDFKNPEHDEIEVLDL